MYILIKQLFQLLSFKQRLRFFKLQLLVIVMSVCEVVSVLSIVPFMTIVGDPSIIEAPGLLGDLFRTSGLDDINTYLISLGFAVLVLLVFSALISMLTTWHLSMFANKIGVELADAVVAVLGDLDREVEGALSLAGLAAGLTSGDPLWGGGAGHGVVVLRSTGVRRGLAVSHAPLVVCVHPPERGFGGLAVDAGSAPREARPAL